MVFLCLCGGLIWENRVHVCRHRRCSCGWLQYEGRGHCCGYTPDYSKPPTDWELYSGFRCVDEWMGSPTWGKRSPSLFGTKKQETRILNTSSSMEEIKNLQQTGSFQDYCSSFDFHLTKVILSEDYATSLFVEGLKSEIKWWVKFLSPKTLKEAYEMAKNQNNLLTLFNSDKGFKMVDSQSVSIQSDKKISEIDIRPIDKSGNSVDIQETINQDSCNSEYALNKNVRDEVNEEFSGKTNLVNKINHGIIRDNLVAVDFYKNEQEHGSLTHEWDKISHGVLHDDKNKIDVVLICDSKENEITTNLGCETNSDVSEKFAMGSIIVESVEENGDEFDEMPSSFKNEIQEFMVKSKNEIQSINEFGNSYKVQADDLRGNKTVNKKEDVSSDLCSNQHKKDSLNQNGSVRIGNIDVEIMNKVSYVILVELEVVDCHWIKRWDKVSHKVIKKHVWGNFEALDTCSDSALFNNQVNQMGLADSNNYVKRFDTHRLYQLMFKYRKKETENICNTQLDPLKNKSHQWLQENFNRRCGSTIYNNAFSFRKIIQTAATTICNVFSFCKLIQVTWCHGHFPAARWFFVGTSVINGCFPCQRFTPNLMDIYNELVEKCDIKILFILAVRDEEFTCCYSKMPWLAVLVSNSQTREALNKCFKVNEIPHLVLFGENGKLLCDHGVEIIGEYECDGYPCTSEHTTIVIHQLSKNFSKVLVDHPLNQKRETSGKSIKFSSGTLTCVKFNVMLKMLITNIKVRRNIKALVKGVSQLKMRHPGTMTFTYTDVVFISNEFASIIQSSPCYDRENDVNKELGIQVLMKRNQGLLDCSEWKSIKFFGEGHQLYKNVKQSYFITMTKHVRTTRSQVTCREEDVSTTIAQEFSQFTFDSFD